MDETEIISVRSGICGLPPKGLRNGRYSCLNRPALPGKSLGSRKPLSAIRDHGFVVLRGSLIWASGRIRAWIEWPASLPLCPDEEN
jgi:hypothetical protein